MKKFLFSTLLLICFSAFAQSNRYAALLLSIDDSRGQCTVVVDNQSQTSSNGQFEFLRLHQGTVQVQVLRRGRTIASDYIDVRWGNRTVVKLSFPWGLQVVETRPYNTEYCNEINDDDDDDDFDNDRNCTKDNDTRIIECRRKTYSDRDHQDDDYRIAPDVDCGRKTDRRYGSCNNDEMEYLKRRIRRETFDNDKLEVFREIIGQRNLNSLQIAELISLLTFDSGKLKAAQLAYPVVIDPESFYMEVSDELSFSSSKKELRRICSRN